MLETDVMVMSEINRVAQSRRRSLGDLTDQQHTVSSKRSCVAILDADNGLRHRTIQDCARTKDLRKPQIKYFLEEPSAGR